MTVGINPAGLKVGNYQGLITVSDPDAENSPQTIQVNLLVQPRVAPVLSNLAVNLVKLNDPTCANPEAPGSRFQVSFNYSDINGDLPISGGSFAGTPVGLEALLPNETFVTANTTATVNGSSFSGQAGFQLCIYFGPSFNSWVRIWVTLEDEWALVSNQLFIEHPRPSGANSPSQASGSDAGSWGVQGSGSVVIPGGGGGG
jgi:hypothetical protein